LPRRRPRASYTRERESFTAWCSSKSLAALPATLAAYIFALAMGATTRRSRRPRKVAAPISGLRLA
jgi:hypothetical protein